MHISVFPEILSICYEFWPRIPTPQSHILNRLEPKKPFSQFSKWEFWILRWEILPLSQMYMLEKKIKSFWYCFVHFVYFFDFFVHIWAIFHAYYWECLKFCWAYLSFLFPTNLLIVGVICDNNIKRFDLSSLWEKFIFMFLNYFPLLSQERTNFVFFLQI